jgi:hypothetical protein
VLKLPLINYLHYCSRYHWPRGLRRGSAAALLLGLRVRFSPGSWKSVFCECCVLSGRGLCIGLITRPEEFYRVWCVWVWSWSLDNEEALALGAVEPWENKILYSVWCKNGVKTLIILDIFKEAVCHHWNEGWQKCSEQIIVQQKL